jgi:hypothetical protein
VNREEFGWLVTRLEIQAANQPKAFRGKAWMDQVCAEAA